MAHDVRSEREGSRILVAGSKLLQESITVLLEQRRDLDIAGVGAAADVVALARDLNPELVVMELTPGGGGIPPLRALGRSSPPVPAVLLVNHCARDEIAAALDAGAAACISVEGGTADLLEAIRAVRERRRYIGPHIADLLMRGAGLPPRTAERGANGEQLTTREREVLALIAEGKTEREIARTLNLSPKTVHTHRTSMMSKMRVHNVIGLVRRAMELGIVQKLAVAVLTLQFT